MSQEKKGKPDAWSDELWAVYKHFGDSDHVYVESCNRFLKATLDLYQGPIFELIGELVEVCLDQDMEPNPEDQLDVYRTWYDKHIKWVDASGEKRPCFCGIDDWFVDEEGTPLMKHDDEKEEFVPPVQVRPWFLGASIQLARRIAEGEVPEPRQGLLSEPKSYDTRAKTEKYLAESGWAVDQLWLEEAPDWWLPNGTRQPEQSKKDFINGLFKWLNIFMAWQLRDKALARPHHRKELMGGPPDPRNKHEEILVRKMFGEKNKKIIAEMGDALPKGDPENAKRAIRERVNLMAEYLGLIPPTGEET